MGQMAREWAKVEANLQSAMDALALEIQALREAGEAITPGKLYRMERYSRLLFEVRRETFNYVSDYAVGVIRAGQEEAVWLGAEEAKQVVRLGLQAQARALAQITAGNIEAVTVPIVAAGTVSPAFVQLGTRAARTMIGLMGDGTPLQTYLQGVYGDAARGMTHYLTNAIAQGLNPRQTARAMTKGLDIGLDRALCVARTETMRAYNAAALESYRESGVVSGFRRLAADDACLACFLEDGDFYETEDEMEDHPNGACVAVPIVEGVDAPDWETGRQQIENGDEDFQRERLGDARYEMWQSGQANLSDFSQHNDDPIWGGSFTVAPLKDLAGSSSAAEAAA
jgi:hypothetical protein